MNKKRLETIPDEHRLFYHIAVRVFTPEYNYNEIPPHAFTPVGENLSVNWEKYCKSAEDCLSIKTKTYPSGRTSLTHGIGHFVAKDVRDACFQLKHAPSLDNEAHSEIGNIPPHRPKPPFNEVRKKLSRIFKRWDIEPSFQPQKEVSKN